MASLIHGFTVLSRGLKPLLWPGMLLLLAMTLCACGGTSLRQEPSPKHVVLDTSDVMDGLHVTHAGEAT